MRVSSQLPGVSAELVAFSRFENTLTLKLRFVNKGKDSQTFSPSSNSDGGESSYLLDEATGKRYEGSDRTGRSVSVPAGDSVDFWIKYVLLEGERPRHLTAVLNEGILLGALGSSVNEMDGYSWPNQQIESDGGKRRLRSARATAHLWR